MVPRSLTTKNTTSTRPSSITPHLTTSSILPPIPSQDREPADFSLFEDSIITIDVDDPYNPLCPNIYESGKALVDIVDDQSSPTPKSIDHSNLSIEITHECHPIPLNSSDLSPPTKRFGERMLYKQGWKGAGFGLGKDGQGINAPLIHIVDHSNTGISGCHNSLPTMGIIVQASVDIPNDSPVIVLCNMVGHGQVDPDLAPETASECQIFGTVIDCIVDEAPPIEIESKSEDDTIDTVRIFVHFDSIHAAKQAKNELHDRYFAGRRVKASFYPELAFKEKKYRLPLQFT